MVLGNKGIYQALNVFVQGWSWPGHVHSTGLREIFSPPRVDSMRKAKHLKCTASEAQSLYPVLACFVAKYVMTAPEFRRYGIVYLNLADLIDTLLCTAYGCITSDMIRHRVGVFLKSVVNAGWRKWVHAKFHWTVHFGDEYDEFGFLPTCFPLERKHTDANEAAHNVKNTATLEDSVLDEMTCTHLAFIQRDDSLIYSIGLIKPHPAPRKLREFLVDALNIPQQDSWVFCSAAQARFSLAGTCKRRDVVLVEDGIGLRAGELWFMASAATHNDDPAPLNVALISLWTCKSVDKHHGIAEWFPVENPILCDLASIEGVCACRRYTDHVLTIFPSYLRARLEHM